MNVFITWSGNRSHAVAKILHDWIPDVIQRVQPFLSSEETAKGSNWEGEITKRLRTCPIGIICLTPDNLEKPWVLFEAGAISNNVEVNLSETGQVLGIGPTRACTYLLDLKPTDVKKPLEMFQATIATDKGENRKLLTTINDALGKDKMDAQQLDRVFERNWGELEKQLGAIPKQQSRHVPKRDPDEILLEVLTEVRNLSKQVLQQSSSSILETLLLQPQEYTNRQRRYLWEYFTARRHAGDDPKGLLAMSEAELAEMLRRRATTDADVAEMTRRRSATDADAPKKPDEPSAGDKEPPKSTT